MCDWTRDHQNSPGATYSASRGDGHAAIFEPGTRAASTIGGDAGRLGSLHGQNSAAAVSFRSRDESDQVVLGLGERLWSRLADDTLLQAPRNPRIEQPRRHLVGLATADRHAYRCQVRSLDESTPQRVEETASQHTTWSSDHWPVMISTEVREILDSFHHFMRESMH